MAASKRVRRDRLHREPVDEVRRLMAEALQDVNALSDVLVEFEAWSRLMEAQVSSLRADKTKRILAALAKLQKKLLELADQVP